MTNTTSGSTSLAPVRKVAAGATAGAVTVILVWVLHEFAHVEIPGEVGSAFTVLVSFAAGYITPKGTGEQAG